MKRLVPLVPALAAAFLSSCAVTGGPALRPLREGRGRLTNPLLDVDSAVEFHELSSFKDRLEGLRERLRAEKRLDDMAVYFRDLNNGPWFGIDASDPYSPASLFKVPIMMSILKEAESNAGLLRETVSDEAPSEPTTPSIPPARSVEPGRPYTVEELLRLMIAESDNRAHEMLLHYLDRKVFSRVFSDLGLRAPDIAARDAQMGVKDYATFYRILYNASYLSRPMSELALSILASSSFKDGLVAGVPAGVVVAHKFGEREYQGKSQLQLHDCGIVYHPRTPYVLCVMTRGGSLKELMGAIRDMSALVYSEVDKQPSRP